MRDKV